MKLDQMLQLHLSFQAKLLQCKEVQYLVQLQQLNLNLNQLQNQQLSQLQNQLALLHQQVLQHLLAYLYLTQLHWANKVQQNFQQLLANQL